VTVCVDEPGSSVLPAQSIIFTPGVFNSQACVAGDRHNPISFMATRSALGRSGSIVMMLALQKIKSYILVRYASASDPPVILCQDRNPPGKSVVKARCSTESRKACLSIHRMARPPDSSMPDCDQRRKQCGWQSRLICLS